MNYYDGENAKKVLALLETFSPEMQEDPDLVDIKETIITALSVEEGSPFVDFTVVQDPDDPENSTVMFSDYIGKGKYILVDFWSTACQPCWDVMPKLKDIYNTYHSDNFDYMPCFFLFGPDGTILKREIPERKLEKTVKKALGV